MRRRAGLLALALACGGPAAPAPAPLALPSPPTTADAAPNAAVACLDPWTGGAGTPKLDPRPVDPVALADAQRMPAGPRRDYALARVYYEAHEWVDAAKALRAIAMRQVDSDVGLYAAELYLDALDTLGGPAHRRACFDDMQRDLPVLAEKYCTSATRDESTCRTFARMSTDVSRMLAEEAVTVGRRDRDPARIRAGAERYERLMKTCVTYVKRSCEDFGYDAGVAFELAGDRASAARVAAFMLDPRNGMSNTVLAARLGCVLGADAGACP